ncbi:MAG: 3-dehydroquinate synthase, partial [Dehalococcoidales bacterium]|nr:3-dehydroquinate synthase [Dehalococcoidales bacterium]
AEVIKYGVIRDEQFFTYLERNLDRIKSLDGRVTETVVFRAAKIKARVVEKDERDFGLRNILNFGHTVGHAIESVSNFKVRHGEAIAIGMVVAARIANEMGILDKNEVIRLKSLIIRTGLPTEVPSLKLEELIGVMSHDKKILQDKLRFILPKAIGEVFIADDVTPSLIQKALSERDEKA